MKGLRQYLEHCADYIISLHKQGRLSGVVLCGGITNPKFHPGISEAATSAEYLREILAVKGFPVDKINICLEETSCNTTQNIVFTGYLMQHRNPYTAEELISAIENDPKKAEKMILHGENWHKLSHNIVFVCDKYRWVKVKIMLSQIKILLTGDFQLTVKSFPRKDIHPNSSWLRQLGAALIYLADPLMVHKDLLAKPK